MSDRSYYRFERLVHIPEPEVTRLSPDLEWMLHSHQASEPMIFEILVYEHYDRLFRLALSLLDDQGEARRAVIDTVYVVLRLRGKYLGDIKVSLWLHKLLVSICRRKLRSLNFGRMMAAFIPRLDLKEQQNVYPRTEEEADLWLSFDSLTYRHKIPVLLHLVHGLSIAEIAQVADLNETVIRENMGAAFNNIKTILLQKGHAVGDLKADLTASLDRRWPMESRTRVELAGVYAEINRKSANRLQSQHIWNIIRKSSLTVGMLLIVGLISFTAYQTLPDALGLSNGIPEKNEPNSPQGANDQGVIDSFGQTQEQEDLPDALTVQSSLEEIRNRMKSGDKYWSSVFLDVQIIHYGIPGYVGPPKVYRNQAWFTESNKIVLSGPFGGEPDNWLNENQDNVAEGNLRSGIYQFYKRGGENVFLPGSMLIPPSSELGLWSESITRGLYPEMMVLPDFLAEIRNEMRVLGGNTLLGRQTLNLRVGPIDDGNSRVWIDAQTGIILRWQRFAEGDPSTVLEEAIVNAIEFNIDTPLRNFSLSSTSYERLDWTRHWSQSHTRQPTSTTKWSPPQGRTTRRLKIRAPVTMSLSDNRIIFQWQPTLDLWSPLDAVEPSEKAELFSKGYFIGEVEMGNPWNLYCERSRDGQKIAFLEPVDGHEGYLYAANNLRWIDLRKPRTRTVLTESLLNSSDFAFSPDSLHLAYWACPNAADSCGVYIHDLTTEKSDILYPLTQAAVLFTWSFDGRYLAFIDAHLIFYIARIKDGKIIYTHSLDWQDVEIPQDTPVKRWYGKFPPDRPGLEGCVNPPGDTGRR